MGRRQKARYLAGKYPLSRGETAAPSCRFAAKILPRRLCFDYPPVPTAPPHQLIILDELGFIPFSSAGAQLLFQFCSALHEQVALIVTTNLAFSDWPQVFGDARLTAPLIDRLTYHAHIFEFRGQSYRFLNHAQEVTTEPTMTT